ncbi:DUF378 domain-containing protein [Achromobacter sp. Root83]|uniref:DUF378 domain-containing protein n=1 Tax=Achromobacter sp. Root83 TaxID=1736602 RepID=UPI001F477097|nr:DUF378 domain-containing protein [Achromobacter sp. Root83]
MADDPRMAAPDYGGPVPVAVPGQRVLEMDISGGEDGFPVAEEDAPDLAAPPAARGLSTLDWAALIAVVAGGLNCGLIAAVNLDVFARMLPYAVARAAYGLIGLAALYCVVLLFRLGQEPD